MQLSLLNNFQILGQSCDSEIQEAVARLYEEFKIRFYPVEKLCCICRKKCSKIIQCNGTCDRHFGKHCLSKASYDNYLKSENWECRFCTYNKSFKKSLIKNVDPNIDEILNQLQLSKYRTSFYKISFEEFKKFTVPDFYEMNIPLGPSLKLSKYLKELHIKTINYTDLSIDNLNNMYYILYYYIVYIFNKNRLNYPSKAYIDVTNQNIRQDEINSITPSMIVINSVSPFPDHMTKEELSSCSSFVRTLKRVGMRTVYRTHRYHKPYNYDVNMNLVNKFFYTKRSEYEPVVYKRIAKENLDRLENYVYYNEEKGYNRVFTSHEILKKIAEYVLSLHIFESEDMYIDMCCGENIFGSLLGVNFVGYDIFPPKYNCDIEHYSFCDWLNTYNLPNKGNVIIGLRPPISDSNYITKKFIQHSFELFPKYLLLYIPQEIQNSLIVPDYFTLYATRSISLSDNSTYVEEDSALPDDAQEVNYDNLYIYKRNNKYVEAKNQQLKERQQQHLLKQNTNQYPMKRSFNNYSNPNTQEVITKLPKYN